MAAVVHASAGGLGASSADEPVELGFLEAVDEDDKGDDGGYAVMHEDGNWLRWSAPTSNCRQTD